MTTEGFQSENSEQYMGEAGRRQTGHRTPTLRPQPRLERRNYRESWNLLKEHFDGVKVTDIDTRFLRGLRETRSQDKARRGRLTLTRRLTAEFQIPSAPA